MLETNRAELGSASPEDTPEARPGEHPMLGPKSIMDIVQEPSTIEQ